jgi:hypothetical protein
MPLARIAFLGADEHQPGVRAEHGVLGILAAYRDRKRQRIGARVGKCDVVLAFDRGGHPAPVA